MNDTNANAQLRIEYVSNFSVVYRALLKKRCINKETKEVQPEAFFCRPGNDFHGLSVGFTWEKAIGTLSWYGVAQLDVEKIEKLSLQIVQDTPDHANISGLPRREEYREEDSKVEHDLELRDRLVYDTARAEFLAGELAKISILFREKP